MSVDIVIIFEHKTTTKKLQGLMWFGKDKTVNNIIRQY